MLREELVRVAHNAAQLGTPPHEIVAVLLSNAEPKWQGHIQLLDIEWCLVHAFDMPLRDARDIERWSRFSGRGDWTDADVDLYLAPWITRYLARVGDEQQP